MKYTDFAIRGIDVSQFNGMIDWSKLHDTHFAAIRVGWGRVTDYKFVVNWAGAKERAYRIPYWYLDYYSNHDTTSSAYGITDVGWGRTQAEKCWALLKDDNEGLLFLDIESASIAPKVEAVWSRVEVIAQSFFDTFDKLSGRTNGIYCSLARLKLFSAGFRSRPLWLAWYTSETIPNVIAKVKAYGWTGKALIWQYASDGDIDEDGKGDGKKLGSSYNWLDLNVWVGDAYDWLEWKHGGVMDIKPLAQGDARWGGDLLGTSKTTIAGYGCLITCVTMMLNHLGWAETPGTLNVKLRDNGGFHSGNLFVWGSLSALYPGVKFAYRYSGSATDKINASLAAGMPVIVHVDYNPSTPAIDEHWVLVVGRQDGDYVINDPKDGKQLLFSTRYGVASKNIHTVCTYNFAGTVEPVPEPTPIEAGQVVKTLVNLNIRKGAGTGYSIWATAKKGTELDVLEVRGDWVRVGWNQWCISRLDGVEYLRFE